MHFLWYNTFREKQDVLSPAPLFLLKNVDDLPTHATQEVFAMRALVPSLFTVIALLLALPQAGVGIQQEAKIVTISDEAAPIPGAVTVSEYRDPLPYDGPRKTSVPQMDGWPVTMGMDPMFAPSRGLVFSDLNNDGTLEIITSSTDGYVYAWDYTGASMEGFPIRTIEMPQYAPSVADLDGDGDMEIVQFTRGWTSGGRFYIFDHEGKLLPGYPISINNNNISDSPTIYDLDDDGYMEIIVPERAYPITNLHIFEIDGSEWGGNWPVALDHVPASCAAVGDVDADGDVEIAYLSYLSMYLLETDGTVMEGWPLQIPNAKFSYQSPALADLDGDGDLEIIVGTHWDAAGCYVFHHDGTGYEGWPNLFGTWSYCPPTVTDLEGDGELEILDGRAGSGPGSYSYCFYCWTSDGETKYGFPYGQNHGGGSEGPITIADINNDGYMEIFADHNIVEGDQGYLFGVDAFGNDLPDFPLRPIGFTYMNGATIGDVDGDGDYELGVISYWEPTVYVNLYDLSGTYHPSDVAWETYHQKNTRGGLYRGEDRLHIQGYFGLGSTVNFYLHDEPGYKAYLFVSLGHAMQYVPDLGWLYLDWSKRRDPLIFNELIPADGEIMVSVTIPNKPSLIGRTVYFQGLTGAKPGAGDGSLSNMLARTIQPAP
jgi:hypothetical protein